MIEWSSLLKQPSGYVVAVAASKFTKSQAPLPDGLLDFVASRFRILAVPMRLRILHALQKGELTVTQIMEAAGASQANTSKHLGVMARAKMVGRRKEGLKVYYSIVDPVIFELCDLVCNTHRGSL
jgi:DNA-binding transcriptional ArsR family regulator